MEHFLSLVQEQPQQEVVQIDKEKLKQFLRKVKVWDYARLSFDDYQRLSVNDRPSILRNYYIDMVKKYSGPGKFLLFAIVWLFLLAILLLFTCFHCHFFLI